MANKKKAGTERPYTWREFREIIEDICKEQNVVMIKELEYFDSFPDMRDKSVDDNQIYSLESTTVFGGSEGVYSDFYVRIKNERKEVLIAKNCSGDKNTFIKMHEFAARVCLICFDYLDSHKDEFAWTGYNVGYWKDGKRVNVWICANHETAMRHAMEIEKDGDKPYIRNNKSREYEEV